MKRIFLTIGILSFLSISVFSQNKFSLALYKTDFDVSILEKGRADSIFNIIRISKILDFNYTRGGCNNRVHAVYLLLKKLNVKCCKIWNFPESKIFLGGEYKMLNVKDKMSLENDEDINNGACNSEGIQQVPPVYWGYHVAPIIFVNNKDKIDTMVVDPALSDKLMDYKDWIISQIQPNSASFYIFLNPEYIDFQTESKYINNNVACSNCSGNDIITGVFFNDNKAKSEFTVETKISQGRVIGEYYKEVMVPIINKINLEKTNQSIEKELNCDLAKMKAVIYLEDNFSKLPDKYKNRLDKYIEEAKQTLD
jgi:hypothetical protein